jgi:hypothetical protein
MDLCEGLNGDQCEALDALAKFLKENDKYSKIINDLIDVYGGSVIPLIIINYIILKDMVLDDQKLREMLLGKDNIKWV